MRLRLQWILLLASLIYAAQEQSISTEDGYYHLAPRTGISNNPTYLESSVDTLYKVGPGDFFELMMENQSILVQVSPEGTVGAELIGVVSVVNLPLWEAKKKILAAMVKVYTEKECFVKLAQIRAPMINVYGAVSIPGQVVLRPGGRLSSVLRDLGGLLPKANADSVLLIRDGDTTLLSYLNAESGIDVKGDPLLQGGDVVIVPEFGSSESVIHVYFAGMAARSIPYHKGWHVGKYIQQSRLMRLNQSAHTHIEIQNSESLKSVVLPINKALTLEPAPDDVLILFSQNASVYVGGAVNHSGPIEYNPTKTPQHYVSEAGLSIVSDISGMLEVTRKDGRVEWIDRNTGIVEPGDYINVPKSKYESIKDMTVFVATLIGAISTAVLIWVNTRQ